VGNGNFALKLSRGTVTAGSAQSAQLVTISSPPVAMGVTLFAQPAQSVKVALTLPPLALKRQTLSAKPAQSVKVAITLSPLALYRQTLAAQRALISTALLVRMGPTVATASLVTISGALSTPLALPAPLVLWVSTSRLPVASYLILNALHAVMCSARLGSLEAPVATVLAVTMAQPDLLQLHASEHAVLCAGLSRFSAVVPACPIIGPVDLSHKHAHSAQFVNRVCTLRLSALRPPTPCAELLAELSRNPSSIKSHLQLNPYSIKSVFNDM